MWAFVHSCDRKKIDSGFHIAFSFIIGLITDRGANVEVALTAEHTIQTLQLVKVLGYPWVYCLESVWNTINTCAPF